MPSHVPRKSLAYSRSSSSGSGAGGVEHRLERGGVRAEFGCEPCGRAHRLDVIFIGALRLGLEKEGGKRVVDGLTRKVLQLLGDHGLALYI